jgi:hypothetical protein
MRHDQAKSSALGGLECQVNLDPATSMKKPRETDATQASV